MRKTRTRIPLRELLDFDMTKEHSLKACSEKISCQSPTPALARRKPLAQFHLYRVIRVALREANMHVAVFYMLVT